MTHTSTVRRTHAPPPAPDADLDALLKRLHLANARRVWRDLLALAEREEWTYEWLLRVLVSEEIAQRQQTRLARLSRRAGFPFLKTIDDFNFTYQSTLRLALLGSALSPDFVTEGRALVFLGKPGRGKTHLAIAIAYRAIQNGFDARFVTAAELIDDLSAAFRAGRLAEALTAYTHPDVLVVDEVGYLTYGTDAANMLFHVVNDRHRHKRAMLFTTNKPVATWGRVLHDEDLANAIVDRVLERGRLLTLDGPSLRTKHLGLDDPAAAALSPQVARISGTREPEFPEPTPCGEHRCNSRVFTAPALLSQYSFRIVQALRRNRLPGWIAMSMRRCAHGRCPDLRSPLFGMIPFSSLVVMVFSRQVNQRASPTKRFSPLLR